MKKQAHHWHICSFNICDPNLCHKVIFFCTDNVVHETLWTQPSETVLVFLFVWWHSCGKPDSWKKLYKKCLWCHPLILLVSLLAFWSQLFLIVVVCSFNDLQKKPYYLSECSFKILRKAPTAQTQLKSPVRWYLNTFNVSIRGTAV